MRILHICPTDRLTAPCAPESLQYLGHHIDRFGADEVTTADRESLSADIVIADATCDLSLAPRIAEVLTSRMIFAPIIVVLSEGGLATASARWRVADLILTTAGPAEVEARLRVARDRHLDAERTGPRASARSAISGHRAVSAPSANNLNRAVTADSANNFNRASSAGSFNRAVSASSFNTTNGLNGTNTTNSPNSSNSLPDAEPMIVATGTLRIDETAFTAELGGRSLGLTYREFALLKFFALHPQRVFTRDEILLAVWGDDYFGGTRTVDVHVRRLRAKLGKDLETAIHTVRNVGYRFSADSVTEARVTEAKDVKV